VERDATGDFNKLNHIFGEKPGFQMPNLTPELIHGYLLHSTRWKKSSESVAFAGGQDSIVIN